MTNTSMVRSIFDETLLSIGFTRHAGSWYLDEVETIIVLNLQRSAYSPQYYVNVGIWLKPLTEARFPRERSCHIRTRLTQLSPSPRETGAMLSEAYFESDPEASLKLAQLLMQAVSRLRNVAGSLSGLRTAEGERLLAVSLVSDVVRRFVSAD